MRHVFALAWVLPLAAIAQHCGYCGASVIVVHAHAEGDTVTTPGLRITLLDSANLPVTFDGRPCHPFLHNTDRSSFGSPMLNHRPLRGAERIFPFAKDYYVLVIPRWLDLGRMRILVQDERDAGPRSWAGGVWPVRFRQTVAPLSAFDSHPLCGRYDDEVYAPWDGRPGLFPVEITLYP